MKSLKFIIASIAVAAPAFACRCGEKPSVAEATLKADAIFVGRVMKLSVSHREDEGEVIECEFAIVAALKGVAAKEERATIITNSSSPACGYQFRIGDEYLVYARKEQKELATSVCMRTRPRLIIDENQDFSDISKVKGDDAMDTEVPNIREVLKK